MKALFAALGLMSVVSSSAYADGFKLKDLSKISIDPSNFAGGSFELKVQKKRISIMCPSCEKITAIVVFLGENNDGTEQRFRQGTTKLKDIEKLCKEREPSCLITGTEIGGAVGWTSTYEILDGGFGSTTVLFQDGDQLGIRSLGSDAESVNSNLKLAQKLIAPQIIGEAK